MDNSQLEALKQALTKEFAIIQGPPGMFYIDYSVYLFPQNRLTPLLKVPVKLMLVSKLCERFWTTGICEPEHLY